MTLDPEKIPIIEADINATLKTIAGAGTGKTSVLVARYLKFVFEDGVAPDRLLALTFTTKAASEMRTRIFREAAEKGDVGILRKLHSAWIMNFHQFSFRLIKENAASFGVDPGVDVATDLDLSRIRLHLFRRFESGKIDGFPDEYEDDMPEPARLDTTFERWFSILARARGTLWTRESLLGAQCPEDLPAYRREVQSITALWSAYENELRRRNLVDFADMIRIAVWGLRENTRLRERYINRFEHILVDEFQDTSEAQNELLRILSGGDFARVTVVGDDKQSIYRWRDARVQNLREFAGVERFLRTNHRSTQNILDLAHYFIISDPYFEKHASDIRLTADRGESEVPVCVFHPSDESPKSFEVEAKGLAAWVLSVAGGLGEGASPFAYYREKREPLGFGDIAVLMRSLKASSGLPEYERTFRDAGIPYTVSGGGGSLEIRALERLRDLLRVLVYPDDMKALLNALENKPFSLTDASLKELFAAGGVFEIDAILSEERCGKISNAEARESCAKLRALIGELRVKRLTLDLPAFLTQALEAAPFYYHLFEEGADNRLVEAVLEMLVGLVDCLVERNEANLAAFVEALEVVIEGKSVDDAHGSTFPAGRVRVMTIHSAKGLQFPAMAVPGIKNPPPRSEGFHLSKGAGLYLSKKEEWGRGLSDSETYASEKADREQEERCLLYVAMTRAKDHLFISSPFPNGVEQGKNANLFSVVLEALRGNRIPHDEVRETPGIDLGGRMDGGAPKEGEYQIERLVEEWQTERQRLDAAKGDRRPVHDVEFVTWRRLHTFAECPVMYYYRYVVELEYLTEAESETRGPEGGETEEFSGETRLPRGVDLKMYGSFIHRMLFEWMSPGFAREAPDEVFIDDLAGRFGFSSSQKAGARRFARETLGAFMDSVLAKREHVDALEVPVGARIGRFVFRGTIDRIDRANGGYRIIDYKGKTPRDEYAYQIRFYAWVLRKAGKPVCDEALLCYLTRPVESVVVDVSPGRLDEIENDAHRLETAVAVGRFEPSPGGACEGCPFGGVCPHAA